MADRDEAAASDASEEQVADREAAPAPAVSEPARESTARPAPQFGEYAPEGWSWTPETGAAAETGSQITASLTSAVAAPSSGRVPGVPHNLGAGGSPAVPTASSNRAARATTSG